MTSVLIAAAAREDAKARGLAEALCALGFEASAEAPDDAELTAAIDAAACVVVLWTEGPPSPWLTMVGAMALDRKKLINADLDRDATPAPFRAAPRADFTNRDRAGFAGRFQTFVVEIDKLAPTPAHESALPEALACARAALHAPQTRARSKVWSTLAIAAAVILAFGGVGFGVGRAIQAVRNGAWFLATPQAEAALEPAKQTAAPAADPLDWRRVESEPWRLTAGHLGDASALKARADNGEARAQALACLGHLAGADGFLPSPSAARAYCDAAAAQREPAGLYFSWILQRTAPHAGLSAAEANARLAEAARLGWLPAQIDYALAIAPDARAPMPAQTEAGRLWLAAAERNDARGQYHYARWLRDSPAGPRDPAAALPFLERAAARGQPDALHMLATLHRDGVGAEHDEGRARTLYEQAARQQHAPSMFNLADMLRTGVHEERARAIALYQQLACMREQVQISALSRQRLRALGERAAC